METTFSQQILKRDLVAMKGAKEQFVILEHCNWSRHQNRGVCQLYILVSLTVVGWGT